MFKLIRTTQETGYSLQVEDGMGPSPPGPQFCLEIWFAQERCKFMQAPPGGISGAPDSEQQNLSLASHSWPNSSTTPLLYTSRRKQKANEILSISHAVSLCALGPKPEAKTILGTLRPRNLCQSHPTGRLNLSRYCSPWTYYDLL